MLISPSIGQDWAAAAAGVLKIDIENPGDEFEMSKMHSNLSDPETLQKVPSRSLSLHVSAYLSIHRPTDRLREQ